MSSVSSKTLLLENCVRYKNLIMNMSSKKKIDLHCIQHLRLNFIAYFHDGYRIMLRTYAWNIVLR